MRKLGLLLGSDSYTSVYHDVFDGDEVDAMTKLMNDDKFELEEHTPDGRYSFKQTEDTWAVGQVFDINEKPFVLIFHHAYDGVDFELLGQFDSYGDAEEARDKDMSKALEDFDEPFCLGDIEKWDSDRQTVFDTGKEWWVWSILNIKGEE